MACNSALKLVSASVNWWNSLAVNWLSMLRKETFVYWHSTVRFVTANVDSVCWMSPALNRLTVLSKEILVLSIKLFNHWECCLCLVKLFISFCTSKLVPHLFSAVLNILSHIFFGCDGKISSASASYCRVHTIRWPAALRRLSTFDFESSSLTGLPKSRSKLLRNNRRDLTRKFLFGWCLPNVYGV